LFEVLNEQKEGLLAVKKISGPVATPEAIRKHNNGKTGY